MKRDYLGWAALVAALVGTASAEYDLARAAGFGLVLAGCVPAALDVYALRAFAVHRDVPAVVIALVLVNAAAHLVASGRIPMSVLLVIVVSAIAPLVLWRVKALGKPVNTPQKAEEAPEVVSEPRAPRKPAESRTEVPVKRTLAVKPDPLLPDARRVDSEMRTRTGKGASLRALQTELRIGQARAQRIRAALAV
ncbi:hypothetical protein FM076_18725 [Streptomyces albus subsp. chlorinus]|uniref:hypothetical protein n=1 Tax=Streptomyces albus TaxID=1888 RepID=UPI00156D7246|nr:hypothetical protein [Streptomyces albus]NSC23080.1 hypothetical protein [Streptomyces albus subsp. chlorinus]